MPKTRGDHTTKALKELWAANVRFCVAKKGLPQVELAQLVGVSAQVITDWKSGKKSPPSVENLLSFARVVDESAGWLIGDGFHGKKSASNLSHQFAIRLGYERLAALAEVPERELIDEIDRIIGRALVRKRQREKPKS